MKLLLSVVTISFLVFSACAQKSDKPLIFSNKSGAIKGYDPVAYFSKAQAVKGKEDIIYEWQGATWHFENETNKDVFVKNPEKYTPQYGGYCAYGLAKGYKVKIEPDVWVIENGKLYLNYDKSVQKDWDKDRKGYIEKANQNWHKN